MSDKEFTIADMLAASKMASPTEFKAAFDDVFVQKVADAIAGKRTEIAQNYFTQEQEDTEDDQSVDENQPEQQEEDSNEDVEASVGSEG